VLGSLAGKAVHFLDTCLAAGAIENGSWRGLARLDINNVISEFASAETMLWCPWPDSNQHDVSTT
jgi:hypothetical protein